MAKDKKLKYGQTVYYSDELKDDFEKTNLKRIKCPEDYKFSRNNKFYNFWSNVLYYGVCVPLLSTVCYLGGVRVKVKNKESFKEFKKRGGFVYSNHTSFWDMVDMQALVFPSKRTNIIGYTDVLSMPVVKHIVRAIGFIPLPDSIKTYKNFYKALDEDTNIKHQPVLIFPEAHVWPYYTEIRPFISGSFKYPVKFNTPALPITACYRKSKISKHAKITLVVGEPIYPRSDLNDADNREYLHDECYKQMCEDAKKYSTYQYVKYVKRENSENKVNDKTN